MDIYERVARALHADRTATPWDEDRMSTKRRYLRAAKIAVNITTGALDQHACHWCGQEVA